MVSHLTYGKDETRKPTATGGFLCF